MRQFVLIVVLLFSSTAWGEMNINREAVYFGGGFGSAQLNNEEDTNTQWQLFSGYRWRNAGLVSWPDASVALELGIQMVNNASQDGLWFTPVLNLPLTRSVDLLARGGVEIGDESGLLIGIGAAHKIERHMAVRVEYVIRQEMRALQLNLVYHPWARPY